MSNNKIICKKEGRKLLSFFFIINTLYYIYKVMIKKYEEFLNDDIQLNESEERMINEAAEKIAEKIKNGESVDAGLFGSVVDEESEHGNARLMNRTFGAGNGQQGKSYGATKMAVSRKNKAEE